MKFRVGRGKSVTRNDKGLGPITSRYLDKLDELPSGKEMLGKTSPNEGKKMGCVIDKKRTRGQKGDECPSSVASFRFGSVFWPKYLKALVFLAAESELSRAE